MGRKYAILTATIYILVASTMLVMVAPTPSSAEHATCIKSESATCGSLIDWGYVFSETDFESVSFSSTDPSQSNYYGSPSSDSLDSLSFGPLYGYRALYGGVWTIENQSVFNRSTGLGSYDKDNLWVPSYDKSDIGDNAGISAPPYLSTRYITHNYTEKSGVQINQSVSKNGSYELKQGKKSGSIEFGYDDSSSSPFDAEFFADYWNRSVWTSSTSNDFKVKVNTVQIRASVPENTSITVNIYSSKGTIPSSEKLGFVKFEGDKYRSPPEVDNSSIGNTTQMSRRIRHINSNGQTEIGLKRFETPDFSAFQQSDFGTYSIEVNFSRNSTNNKTPRLSNESNITLSRSSTPHRTLSPSYDGYPRQRLNIQSDTKRGERYNLTSSYTIQD